MAKTTLQGKTDRDLHKDLVDLRKRLHDFRFGIAGSKVRNVKEGRNLRRNIARLLTELRSRA